jgi:hypothetical protein
LIETGRTEGVFVLFDGADANENDVGRKNGEAVPFDLVAICCCDPDVG